MEWLKVKKNLKWVFLLTLPLAALSTSGIAADIAAGKSKAATCAGCHGVAGVSLIPSYPNLAGQKAAYTAKQLKAFRDKTRKDPVMGGLAAGLTDTDIENLAAYYASLK
jgi:cytochrome c553